MGLDQGGGRVDQEEEGGAGLIFRMCRLVFGQDMAWGWARLGVIPTGFEFLWHLRYS